MKKYVVILMCLLLVGCNNKDGHVAKVDDVIIDEQNFSENYEIVRKIYDKKYTKSDVLVTLVDRAVVAKELKNRNIEDKTNYIEAVKKDIEDFFGGKKEMIKYLQENGMTVKDYDDYIVARANLAMLKNDFIRNIELTEQELIDEYSENREKYDNYKIQILVMDDKKSITYVLQNSNKNFDELIHLYSTDLESAANGGIIDKYHLGEKEVAFDEALLNLKIGDISAPIKLQNEYCVIKLIDSNLDFTKNKSNVIDSLLNKKFETFLLELKKNSKIKIYTELDG